MDTPTKNRRGNGRAPFSRWHKGPYYDHPWWESQLSEKSPSYEDDKPTNISYSIDPYGPNQCPRCKAKRQLHEEHNPDGDGDKVIRCWICSLTNYFYFDKVIMRWVNRRIDGLEHAANCDPLLSDNECRIKEVRRGQIRKYYWKNREALLAKSSQYSKENKETIKVINKRYWDKNREQLNAGQRERRAAKKEALVGATA